MYFDIEKIENGFIINYKFYQYGQVNKRIFENLEDLKFFVNEKIEIMYKAKP